MHYTSKSKKRKKQFAVEQFGGKCTICEYDKCIGALEFHHTDKSKKKESPSNIIMRWSWKRMAKELEQCVLVCANCHREIHAGLISLPENYAIFDDMFVENSKREIEERKRIALSKISRKGVFRKIFLTNEEVYKEVMAEIKKLERSRPN